MQQPNNAWVEAWQGAVPLPAYKQKRLFDDTREAEKVLHYLAGFRVCDLALSIMPMVLHAALESLSTRQSKVVSVCVCVYIVCVCVCCVCVYVCTCVMCASVCDVC